jgi:hypothetical protein
VEIVAKAKPCVVIIDVESENGRTGRGTGFFIDNDKIITDAHVVRGFESLYVQDLAGNRIQVDPDLLYFNDADEVDLALIQVVGDGTHSYLSLSPTAPLEGQNVTVIGNPHDFDGTVSNGIVSAVRASGDLIQFTASVSNGSSGGPLLDDEGKVIGIVDYVVTADGPIKLNFNFAHGVSLITRATSSSISSKSVVPESTPSVPNTPSRPTPTPAFVEPRDFVFVEPRSFSSNVRTSEGYRLKQVLDSDAVCAISAPVCGYLRDSASGQGDLSVYFINKLDRFFNLRNVSFGRAYASEFAYFRQWPLRSNQIAVGSIVVEIVLSSDGRTRYLVSAPYNWSINNGKTYRKGSALALAFVMPGHFIKSGRPAYFISAIWNDAQ